MTATLRRAPTVSVEIGDPHPDAALAAQGLVATRSYWAFDEPPDPDRGSDAHARLERLTERFAAQEDAFAALAPHYEIRVWVVTAADGSDSAFEISPQVMQRLAWMRATLLPGVRLAGSK